MSETLNAFAIRGLLSGLRSPDVYDGRRFGLIFFRHDSQDCGFHVFRGSHYHQIEQNFGQSWERYSMVVRFGNK